LTASHQCLLCFIDESRTNINDEGLDIVLSKILPTRRRYLGDGEPSLAVAAKRCVGRESRLGKFFHEYYY
jgi:hypothetical protein